MPSLSRLFNHSCISNAVAKYTFSQGQSKLLPSATFIQKKRFYVPYLDPALSETRGKIFQISYGFKCACPLPPVPTAESDRTRLAGELRQFAGIHSGITSLPTTQLEELPVGLRCILREDYISSLSEEFSRASHQGDYTIAFDTGLTLLAVYVVIYPPNYPQIGMHLLELTKTAWNAHFSADITNVEAKIIKERVGSFLSMSSKVLTMYRPEDRN